MTKNPKKKILFILKRRNIYGYSSDTLKSGLFNSARMAAKELEKNFKVDAKLELAVDGNSIDKFLHLEKPDYCILEAIWVTPAKLSQLVGLHPKVKFVVRIHSEVPFLTQEGIAIDWIKQYTKIKNVTIAFNSKETEKDFNLVTTGNFSFLPNLYNQHKIKFRKEPKKHKSIIDISSFGSIRPMKNQLMQAFAAIAYANKIGKKLRFHINSSRQEQGGESTLKNIRALFDNSVHQLVEHDWLERKEFLRLVSKMDFGMQLSLTESFNIVTADFVSQKIPILVSETINWMSPFLQTSTDDIEKIIKRFETISKYRKSAIFFQDASLYLYSFDSLKHWKNLLNLDGKIY